MPVMGQDSSRHSYLRDAMLEKARKGTHSQIHGTGPTGNIVLNVALVTLTHLIFKATFIKLPPTNPLPYWHNYPHFNHERIETHDLSKFTKLLRVRQGFKPTSILTPKPMFCS